jgi:phage repressor protein C with HTH and peptisase S24 domain
MRIFPHHASGNFRMDVEDDLADISAMPPKPSLNPALDEQRAKIAAALAKTEGLDATALALKIGRGKDYVRDFLNGRKQSIKPIDLAAIEQELGLDLTPSNPAHAAPVPASQPVPRPEPAFFDHTNKMPVYSAAEGGEGELIVDTDPIDWVPRPHTLQHVVKAYAVVVTGDSMHPAFKRGDQAWVNPKLRPNPGEDCILYHVEHDIGEERALIKEYVKQTPTHWIVKQYNPEKELHLPKTDWVRIYRVVGKFSR